MTEINILILSAGRRVELVTCFQKAAEKLGIKSNIVAGDCSDTAPALFFANKAVQLPRINEPNYITFIIGVCIKENISLVVPTIDTELLLLAENKKLIEVNTKAKVLISDIQIIQVCRDKTATQRFLEEHGFGVPKMYSDAEVATENIEYPLFIKPKSGSSSINAFKVNNKSELAVYKQIIDHPIIQEYITGDEYTVDVFLDFESNVITTVPRLRMTTRSGEISKGKIVKDQEIIEDVTKLVNVLKPIGHITVQLMKTTRGIKYIEINPRFGGGAPMSIQSGADSCRNLYQLLSGQHLRYNEDYRDNLMYLRFDKSICVNEHMEIIE